MADEKKEQEAPKSAKQIYGDNLPHEVVQSGIGVGYTSETDEAGAAVGVATEDEKAEILGTNDEEKKASKE